MPAANGYDSEYIGDQQPPPPLPAHLQQLADWAQQDNIAKEIKGDTLAILGQKCHEKYKIDDASRSDWAKSARRALELIGGKKEPKNFPFENASNVKYPLLLSAVNQFASRAYPAIIKDAELVKVKVEGKDKGQKLARAQRVEKHMSYQLLHQMEEWDEDTDALMHQLPVVGCAFRKTFWDSTRRRPKSEMVSALDLVVNINAPSLEAAPQICHEKYFYPYEIDERVRKGVFIEQDLGNAEQPSDQDKHQSPGEDTQAPHKFIECHTYYDLDGDGVVEPWIVTVHDTTQKVVRVAPGYSADAIEVADDDKILCIEREHYFTKYIFWPDPKGGFYGRGLGHALEDISEAINTTFNQMLDAGTLQNAGGGFIGSGLNTTKKSTLRFAPGIYHTVAAPGSTIRDAIVNMEHPGASPVLFQLLGQLIQVGREVAGNQDVLTGDVQTNMQPTTLMALIEQGLQQFTAIYLRIYRSLGKEFQKLRKLNARYLSDEQYNSYLDGDEPASATQDYSEGDMDIYPIANPNMVTHMQRAARNQFLMELGKDPELGRFIKKPVVLMRILRDAQIEDIEEVIEENPQPSPAEEAQMKKFAAEAEKAEAERDLTRARVIEIQGKDERMQAQTARERISGALDMMQAEGMALDISFKEALISKFLEIEDVEQITIQGVGSIKEQDKTPAGAGGPAKAAA
jgi:chaperonin GroES